MSVHTDTIRLSTRGRRNIIDCTAAVRACLEKTDCRNGLVVLFVPGSTAAITTIEYEPGLKKDLSAFLERLLPYAGSYHHHATWNDDNGAGHVQASLLGPSLAIPLVNGELTLGTWQQIVLIDCDTRPRTREIVVQILS
jgi:secondary thiamine-phosphate synthase enzyme